MLIFVKLNPEFSTSLLKEAKAILELSSFLLAAKQMAVILSFSCSFGRIA